MRNQWQNADNVWNQTPSLLINGAVSPILNVSLNGTSTDMIPNLCRKMLGNRYAYVNPRLDRIIPENCTDPADISYMETRVKEYSLHTAKDVLQGFWTPR